MADGCQSAWRAAWSRDVAPFGLRAGVDELRESPIGLVLRADASARARALEHRAAEPELVVLAAWLAPVELPVAGDPSVPEPVVLPDALAVRVRDLIARAGPSVSDDDADAAVLSDALLDPVGSAPAAYRSWREVVRARTDWERARAGLLARDTIYLTPESRGGREGAARLRLAMDGRVSPGPGPGGATSSS
jgi:hypothetical protein